MPNDNGIPEATEQLPTASDDPIEKQINMAIEAQDGPAQSTQDADPATGDNKEQKPEDKTASADDKNRDGGTGDNKSQQPVDKEGKENKKQTHSAKDITLGDGTVIKGGAERRFYEQREAARQQLGSEQRNHAATRTELERVQGELNTLKQTTQSLHGVDPKTLQIGVNIVTDLQRDPVGTMKKLLAEVIAQGHTIEGIGAGVDHLAMQRMIDARLPQNAHTEPTDAEILAEAQQEVATFYSTYPDARPHDALLSRMLRDHPTLTLESAYWQLKNAFIEKDFDWSRTLDDNLKDASATSEQQQQQQQQAPMPNGRVIEGQVKEAGEVAIAHEDTDMGDIVRAAMRESGLNVH